MMGGRGGPPEREEHKGSLREWIGRRDVLKRMAGRNGGWNGEVKVKVRVKGGGK
jgi:hypothetical protein